MVGIEKPSASRLTSGKNVATRSRQAGAHSKVAAVAGGATKRQRTDNSKAIRLSDRAEAVIGAVGGVRALAGLMDVSPSQPSRWRQGVEQPSPENSRELIDLDYVFARATLIWEPQVAAAWFMGSNAFLDGARPIDVLKLRGAVEVVAALDAEAGGAFA